MSTEPTTSDGDAALTPAELARARGLGYGLLSDLLSFGITESTRAAAAEVSDGLRAALEGRDPDELAADHEHAFGWVAPPYAGAYLAADRASGGDVEAGLRACFDAAGFTPDTRREGVEHLSVTLRFVAFLCGAEADARVDGEAAIAARLEAMIADALGRALAWTPVWSEAVRRAGRPFSLALVDELEGLMLSHHAALRATAASPPAPPLALPPLGLDLEDESVSLRDVAELLASPARCGAVLSRADIQRLGRAARLPRGFGDRAQIVTNLLRASGRFDQAEDILESLDSELARQADALSRPAVAHLTAPWRDRMAETRALLAEARERVRSLARE